MNILTTIYTVRHHFEWQTLQEKKQKKLPTHKKNSNADTHCTHLPLPPTHKPTKGKGKRVQLCKRTAIFAQ